MSERLNSVDIEDVLSSIRRLVSEDARPAAARAAAQPAPVAEPVAPEPVPEAEPAAELPLAPEVSSAPEAPPEAPAFASSRREAPQSPAPDEAPRRRYVPVVDPQAEKLILTPSLRIVPEPAEPSEEVAAGLSEPEPEAMDEAGAEIEAEAWVEAEAEAPMMEDATEEALEAVEDQPAGSPFRSIRIERGGARLDAVMDQVAQGLDAAEQDWEPAGEVPRAFASDWHDAPEGEGEAVGEAAVEAVAAGADDRAAEFVAAPDLPSDIAAWETAGWATPDWQAVEPAEEAAPELLAGADEAEAWPEEAAEPTDAITDDAPPFMAEEPAMADKDPVADRPDWARTEAEPLPETPFVAAAAAGRATAAGNDGWADAAEAQIRRELEEEVETSAFARFEEEEDHDDRRFDEEMLRDLVRDIIREELQGALGERITRNVRKLVRAEIARALAVRDFE